MDYKNMELILVQAKKELSDCRERYGSEWRKNTEHYTAKEYYKWMAGFVNGCNKILEIGVGDGSSTLELVKQGSSVVGIDINEACIKNAYNNMIKNNVNAVYIEREELLIQKEHLKNKYKKVTGNILKDGVSLIQGNIINDNELINRLSNIGKFDAIICWLIGAPENDIRLCTGCRTARAQEYREKVQESIYFHSKNLLKSNGKIHFVDRCYIMESKGKVLEKQCKLAGETHLIFTTPEYYEYSEPDDGGVKCYEGNYKPNKTYFMSILAKKS